MDPKRQFVVGTLLFAAVALAHALLTWPLRSTVVLFVGGAAIAFLAELNVIRQGLLHHRVEPQVAGVPLVVLAAWPATVYVFYRGAMLVVPAGVEAAALAAVVATLFDVFQDPIGVERASGRTPRRRYRSRAGVASRGGTSPAGSPSCS